MSFETNMHDAAGAGGSDIYAAGTYVYGTNLIKPIKYIQAIDDTVTISDVAETVGGDVIDANYNYIDNAIALTPAMGNMSFPREIMEFTCDGVVKVWYS